MKKELVLFSFGIILSVPIIVLLTFIYKQREFNNTTVAFIKLQDSQIKVLEARINLLECEVTENSSQNTTRTSLRIENEKLC
jgi:hypothetical protein